MRGCFEVFLLIIFHFFSFFCVCVLLRASAPCSFLQCIRLLEPSFLGFNVSGIRARLTARRAPRHLVVRGLPLVRGGARGREVGRAQPQRPLALEREIHRHHAPLAVLAHQFAPRFPRKSCGRAEDDNYPQPAAVAGAYCLTVPSGSWGASSTQRPTTIRAQGPR